jgi:polygalacturonase
MFGEAAGKVKIYPAPKGEVLSELFTVAVAGKKVPVYITKVASADEKSRFKGMDDKQRSADFFDLAAFASFELLSGSVVVTVSAPTHVTSAKILPASANIIPSIKNKSVSFTVTRTGSFTVEVNGEIIKSLHLFVNPPEKGIPAKNDPNVIYFGPGIHEIGELAVGDNKTVYIAGGAIVRAIIKPEEKFTTNKETGLRNYAPSIRLAGKNITIRGRGIIDGSACPTHARNMIMVTGLNIKMEGIILRDPPLWTVPVRRSDNVSIENIKILGYRANSDGIDICNSRNVTVSNCFIRTLDDLVVIKSDKGQGVVKGVLVKNCVLWNQVAHALSVGAEIREDVDDVLFTDNDIIHDIGREWSMRIYHCDAAKISNIRFENIRVDETKKFISVWIGKAVWSRDAERGNINGVTFKNIKVNGKMPMSIALVGYDDAHSIEDVKFEGITLDGKPISQNIIQSNAFVKRVVVSP